MKNLLNLIAISKLLTALLLVVVLMLVALFPTKLSAVQLQIANKLIPIFSALFLLSLTIEMNLLKKFTSLIRTLITSILAILIIFNIWLAFRL